MKKNVMYLCLIAYFSIFPSQKSYAAVQCLTTPPNSPQGCETPGSIECIYGLTNPVPGCPLNGTAARQNGGWGAIAVVEVLDNPCIQNDLNIFSAQFGFASTAITYIYPPLAPSPFPLASGCHGLLPKLNTAPKLCKDHPTPNEKNPCNEHVLDVEWAHAMAPNARIFVVEARSGSIPDKMYAACYAAQAVEEAGGGLVSMSFSDPEFPQETDYDKYFQFHHKVVFIASSGDFSAPARYPSSSPHVISAGGTTIVRNAQGNFIGETAWSTDPKIPAGMKNGGSGGPSYFEPRPSYQNWVMKIVGTRRGTPDISFDANSASGVCVYSSLTNTFKAGWFRTGGTSVSAPALAGILNTANHRADSTDDELNFIYQNAIKNYHLYWHDILQGYNGHAALAGYDFTTGLGSPLGYGGK